MLRVVAVLFLAAALPFARQLLFGAGLLDDDVFLQSLPAWEWLARTLRSGDSLLWSPETMGGFPIAFTQYPFLYPPDLLLARLLPPLQAYSWSLVLHLLLAGLLTYGFCRSLKLGPAASLLSALSFQVSTEVVAGASGFAAHSAFALPGTFLAVELLLRRGGRLGPLVSLVVAAGLLGGHPQLVLMALVAGAAYALFRLALLARAEGYRTAAARGCWLMAAVGLGVLGAGVRLLPTWEVVSLSTRADGLPGVARDFGTLSLQGLLAGYLLPLSRLQTLPWGAPGYAGPAVLLLSVLGLRPLIGQSHGRFFLGLGLLAALLSLGDATPLAALTQLPPLSLFRGPSRFSLVATFSLAILGGMALEGFWQGGKGWGVGLGRRLSVLAAGSFGVVVALLCLGILFQFGSGPHVESLRIWTQSHYLDLLNPLRPRMLLALLGGPLVLLLLALGARGKLSRRQVERSLALATLIVLVPIAAILNPPVEGSVMASVPETVAFLQGQGGLFRVWSELPGMRLYNHLHYYGPGPEAGFTEDLRYRFLAEMLAPVLNLRWGVASADGYEQLHSRYQEILLRYIESERTSSWDRVPGKWDRLSLPQRLRVLQMLNVRFLLSGVDLASEAAGLRLAARVTLAPGPVSRASPEVYLFENPEALPRYYLAAQARRFDSDVDALDAVALGLVDPGTTVLLSAGEEPASSALRPAEGSSLEANHLSVEVLRLRNTEVELRVSSDRPAYLVTSDAYWPGWRAFIDGRETEVLRANVSGRAVWLAEGGEHLVTFRFEPSGFAVGLALSSVALALWAGWAALALLLPRTRPVRPS